MTQERYSFSNVLPDRRLWSRVHKLLTATLAAGQISTVKQPPKTALKKLTSAVKITGFDCAHLIMVHITPRGAEECCGCEGIKSPPRDHLFQLFIRSPFRNCLSRQDLPKLLWQHSVHYYSLSRILKITIGRMIVSERIKGTPGTTRLIGIKSSHRRPGLARRCRFIAPWRRRTQESGCSPIGAVRELGSASRASLVWPHF
jgi:hypothetical protein